MKQIQLLESTVDALVKTYDRYVRALGGEPEGNIDFKILFAIESGMASLHAECLQYEAENKRREEKARRKPAGR